MREKESNQKEKGCNSDTINERRAGMVDSLTISYYATLIGVSVSKLKLNSQLHYLYVCLQFFRVFNPES